MASSVSEPASGSPPVIGLTTYLERAQQGVWDVRAAFLPEEYLDAVTASGAVVALLPPQPHPDHAARAALARLDGLILTGGHDVQPELYGANRHPTTDAPRADRDDWELALLHEAHRQGVPTLAICRGVQVLNTARGGTLHQHLPEVLGSDRYRVAPAVFADTEVEVTEGSAVAAAVTQRPVRVRSYHHQGIDRLGDGLVVTAVSDDGLVQAVENTDGDAYLVGVQWHPEQDRDDRGLFAALVAQAATFASSKTPKEGP